MNSLSTNSLLGISLRDSARWSETPPPGSVTNQSGSNVDHCGDYPTKAVLGINEYIRKGSRWVKGCFGCNNKPQRPQSTSDVAQGLELSSYIRGWMEEVMIACVARQMVESHLGSRTPAGEGCLAS